LLAVVILDQTFWNNPPAGKAPPTNVQVRAAGLKAGRIVPLGAKGVKSSSSRADPSDNQTKNLGILHADLNCAAARTAKYQRRDSLRIKTASASPRWPVPFFTPRVLSAARPVVGPPELPHLPENLFLGDSPLFPQSRVLIVDRSRESRDLLRSFLSRHGAEVIEAPVTERAAMLADHSRPDLIVVDVETQPYGVDSDGATQLAAVAARNDIPIVVLGTLRRSASPLPTDEFVAKPYHYGALIRRIEELLGKRT
jgi:CheY-like chemotaxis protein